MVPQPLVRRTIRALLAAFAVALLAVPACKQSSPNDPSPTPTPTPTSTPSPVVTSVSVSGGGPQVGATSQMSATAFFSNNSSQSVTTSANWSSTNTSLATVNSSGIVTGVGVGSVEISATFQNVRGASTISVLAAPTFSVNGVVTDATSRGILPNILIGISGGTNVGASTRTDGQGRYTLAGLRAGTMTVSASAVSYQTVDQAITLSGSRSLDFVLPRVPTNPTPTPTPGPPQPPPPAGTAIQFITDSSTCRCWDSTISLRVDGQVVGSMSCSGSFTVGAQPGNHSTPGCDSTGCLTQNITVTSGNVSVIRLFCTGSAATAGGGKSIDCVGATAIKR